MAEYITTERIPIQLWLDDIEVGALQQAKNLANLPFAHHHIAIMPDAHLGYGMPIGGVLATEDTVIPNGVGVDIGCGVCAQQTSHRDIPKKQLKRILSEIRKAIPVGFKHHKQKQSAHAMPKIENYSGHLEIIEREYENGRSQIGTLGGGNHFIEIQKGSDSHIWIMLHSGSRNIGYQVANHYNRVAIKNCRKHHSQIPAKWQLAHLPLTSAEGRSYMAEMQYCIDFAYASRQHMMQTIREILVDLLGETAFLQEINVAHNYAAEEHHFGKDVIVHRKGATRAYSGEFGIIPGSQGSSSYIVTGKGNRESFSSCSHGAGRRLGRKQAQRNLNLQQEIDHLEKKDILHSLRGKRDLDEAAGAYKDIDTVMNNQTDLVDIAISLTPMAVVKG